jgi:tetraacyldisaccharide 4'-kinase
MLREAVQRRLELGSASWSARALSRIWEQASRVERPLSIPFGVKVIGVGGATLGGSFKTPAVLALAREIASSRAVAVVASSYRAKPRVPRRVQIGDPIALVGDEAAHLARELAPLDVPVFVGPTRDSALALAAEHARIVIIDGLLQSRPERVALSLLVVDGASPWGSGRCPPAGDLRAPVSRLLRAADVAVVVGDGPDLPLPTWRATSELARVRTPDGPVLLHDLREKRVGLALAIARPERVRRRLMALGVRPEAEVLLADHARFDLERLRRTFRERRLDAWVTTGKCATKLGPGVWVLEHHLHIEKGAVPGALEAW